MKPAIAVTLMIIAIVSAVSACEKKPGVLGHDDHYRRGQNAAVVGIAAVIALAIIVVAG